MASTFTAAKAASTIAARSGIDITAQFQIYAITAALVLNDVIQMFNVPVGATILDVTLGSDDMDTSTGILLDVGDGNSVARFISASTVGQASGVARLGVAAGLNYTYTAADTIDIKVNTAATGTAATTGNLYLNSVYTLQS